MQRKLKASPFPVFFNLKASPDISLALIALFPSESTKCISSTNSNTGGTILSLILKEYVGLIPKD